MSVPSLAEPQSYTGNNTTLAFSWPYYFLQSSDLQVSIYDSATGITSVKTLNTDYTISGAGVPGGGTVTMVVAPTSTQTLTISQNITIIQTDTYLLNDSLPSSQLQVDFDRACMIEQQLYIAALKSISFPISDSLSLNTVLPLAVNRALKNLSFDANGNVIATVDIGQNRGMWSTGTTYNYRDIFIDPASGNLCWVTASPSYVSGATVAVDIAAGNAAIIANVSAIVAATTGAQIYNTYQYAVSSSSANTYTATLTPVPTSYQQGMLVSIKITNGNTGSATLNLNSIGTVSIYSFGSALVGGEMPSGHVARFLYDGTYFVLLNPIGVRKMTGQTFVTTGSQTYTPTAGTKFAVIEIVGAGGGGGASTSSSSGSSSAGGGGGGGGYVRKLLYASQIGATATIVIGSLGNGGGSSGSNGSSGGNTTFTCTGSFSATVLTASGGPGGYGGSSSASAGVVASSTPGGASTNGDVNNQGGYGGCGFSGQAGAQPMSGEGGDSFFGRGGQSQYNGAGVNGSGKGGGGSGGASPSGGTAQAGGNGTNGYAIITEFS